MQLAHSRDIEPTPLWPALLEAVERLGPVVVAFSGGVDSTLLAKVCRDLLGDEALAVTAVSSSLAPSEREEARRLARLIGVEHREIVSREDEDARYLANPTDRCYFCKSHLFEAIEPVLAEAGARAVAYGATADDLGDHRPGMRAAQERGVRAPLLEAGLGKAEIREASRRLALPTWDKPALACLASRLPHGTPVTAERLRTVDEAETSVRALGFRQVRVRHFGDVARVEVDPAEVPRALDLADEIERRVRAAGFARAIVDPEGYRQGRLAFSATAAKGER